MSRSEAWDHFTKVGAIAGKAICFHCPEPLDGAASSFYSLSGGTASLFRHLERAHLDVYAKTKHFACKQLCNGREVEIIGIRKITEAFSPSTSSPSSSAQSEVSGFHHFMKDKMNAPMPQRNGDRQGSLVEAIDRGKLGTTIERRHAEIRDLLLNLIISSNSSFSLVENEFLVKLMQQCMGDNFKVMKRRYYSDVLLSQRADTVTERLKAAVKGRPCAITFDVWSKRRISLLSITVHFLSDKFRRTNRLLAAIPLKGSHTGETLATVILEKLSEYDINADQLVGMVRDGAENVRVCSDVIKRQGFASTFCVWCILHILNRVVNDTIFTQPDIERVILKVKTICSFYHKSTIAQEKLDEIHIRSTGKQHTIRRSISIRWNSTFHMCLDVYEMHDSIVQHKLAERTKAKFTALDAKDLALLKKFISIFRVFDMYTLKMSGANATLSSFIPAGKCLITAFEKVRASPTETSSRAKATIDKIIGSLRARFGLWFDDDNLRIATLLDPRFKFKLAIFSVSEWESIVIALLQTTTKAGDSQNLFSSSPVSTDDTFYHSNVVDDEHPRSASLDSLDINPAAVTAAEPIDQELPNKRQRFNFGDEEFDVNAVSLFASVVQECQADANNAVHPTTTTHEEQLKLELDSYKVTPAPTISHEATEDDIFLLQWWSMHSIHYPLLAKLAIRYHAVPPSSIDSERAFSQSSLIYANHLRNRLSAKTAEKIMLVKSQLSGDKKQEEEANDFSLEDLITLSSESGTESDDEET